MKKILILYLIIILLIAMAVFSCKEVDNNSQKETKSNEELKHMMPYFVILQESEDNKIYFADNNHV